MKPDQFSFFARLIGLCLTMTLMHKKSSSYSAIKASIVVKAVMINSKLKLVMVNKIYNYKSHS